ncbi:MAG: tRNA (adenosine(37)-N6)-threonylcarbamoyltransferase complex transferase subunit TsaD [Gemmatimonadales bacterium]|nr:tRNA (adenosine(37)-N6)-threonylcarbamoyltransferase complex transferase subunit TsaD [Gemmatimonadales bacterium]NIN10759.1 tRNA (adenosine(37)-N6)-threonylcarbamoyltransferase complex transferase subunit TsaD [Gemmatimonadales bacterium]NIQ98989.1 tRNA (adenosine(37)-N6)-threonylcarbamoyltransferase complex transferase subunit TsaD [Gemmatimonadales bacterium]NIS63808.1 tRNA (adenosine(37)-N6)-threonylcarbamoyltransferase complex transferase subunit TsaD [Gemmatimonadales bacterium]
MIDVVLGIETSCDETSAAVLVRDGPRPELASLVILSQDIHTVFGGVVPELASRAHLTAIGPVVDQALKQAGIPLDAVDAIAVTAGPGLVGSLLVGVCYAKALAAAGDKALIGVHHLEAHIFAPTIEHPDLEPPFVALIVSGGHTLLLDVPQWGRYRVLGETRDDAAGEAFDKVASMLELGYPGGPPIEHLATQGSDRFDLPRPMLGQGFDFSFSGLKTAVLHTVRGGVDLDADKADIAASFQAAVFDVLTGKTRAAVEQTGYGTVVLGGGVACSRALAMHMARHLTGLARVTVAQPRLNADNAAMIARAGWFHLDQGERSDLYLEADARMPWPGLERQPRLSSSRPRS